MKKQIIILFLMLFTLHLSAAELQFSQQKLDQITAPIALYPDALLSQILMASTYPQQVQEAAIWSRNNTNLQGEAALNAVEYKNWEPSVTALVAFPQVLRMMDQKPLWTQELGDAFLEDPTRVMNTIQHLRVRAKNAGHLRSSRQQAIKIGYDDGVETIAIEPASQNTIYVPVYNPRYVYGTWAYPTYMPFVYYPAHYHPRAGVHFSFQSGIILHTMMLWSSFNWHHHDISINVARYNTAYRHRQIRSNNGIVSWREKIRSRHTQRVTIQRQKDLQQQHNIQKKRDLQYQRTLQYKREVQRKQKVQYERNLQRQRDLQRQQNIQRQRNIQRQKDVRKQRDIQQKRDLQHQRNLQYKRKIERNSQQKVHKKPASTSQRREKREINQQRNQNSNKGSRYR